MTQGRSTSHLAHAYDMYSLPTVEPADFPGLFLLVRQDLGEQAGGGPRQRTSCTEETAVTFQCLISGTLPAMWRPGEPRPASKQPSGSTPNAGPSSPPPQPAGGAAKSPAGSGGKGGRNLSSGTLSMKVMWGYERNTLMCGRYIQRPTPLGFAASLFHRTVHAEEGGEGGAGQGGP